MQLSFNCQTLTECADFNDVKQRIYHVPSLQDLFKTVNAEVILDFFGGWVGGGGKQLPCTRFYNEHCNYFVA